MNTNTSPQDGFVVIAAALFLVCAVAAVLPLRRSAAASEQTASANQITQDRWMELSLRDNDQSR